MHLLMLDCPRMQSFKSDIQPISSVSPNPGLPNVYSKCKKAMLSLLVHKHYSTCILMRLCQLWARQFVIANLPAHPAATTTGQGALPLAERCKVDQSTFGNQSMILHGTHTLLYLLRAP